VAGSSGGGKSTLATAIVERVLERGYQRCVVDPEGDYEDFPDLLHLGGVEHALTMDEVAAILAAPDRSVAVNLLAVEIDERPRYTQSLLRMVFELRARFGRPHWLVFDEAHHLFPHDWDAGASLPSELFNAMLVTVDPRSVAPALLAAVQTC
jgi:hypothetical protein